MKRSVWMTSAINQNRLAIGLRASLAALLCLLLSVMPIAPAWAGPVDWHEVPSTDDGRQ